MDRAQLVKALRDTAQSASNAIAGSVSGPVDLITAALRAGGLNIEKPIGGSEWMNEKGLTVPVEMGAPRIVGETLGMAGPAVVAAKAPQIAAGMNQMIANAQAPSTLNAARFGGQRGAVYLPDGSLSNNLDDAQRFADELRARGLNPKIEQASGGSVYVTAGSPNYTKAGALSKRNPYTPLQIDGKEFKARFADHPSYWGSTASSDPFTGNTVDDLLSLVDKTNASRLPEARFNPADRYGTITEFETRMAPSLSGKSVVPRTASSSRPFSFLGEEYFSRKIGGQP